ncbi:MAG: hypothetical protein JNM89_10460 [Hyphomicrobiaceae bacterium]|nr:hypothetical protein [Hyphomicrobiaceae bacterium]
MASAGPKTIALFALLPCAAVAILTFESAAESVSSCDALKGQTKAYIACVARQFPKNYLPGAGPGPGMTMDEIETQTDKVIDGICNGEGSVCDGEEPGTRIGNCVCR